MASVFYHLAAGASLRLAEMFAMGRDDKPSGVTALRPAAQAKCIRLRRGVAFQWPDSAHATPTNDASTAGWCVPLRLQLERVWLAFEHKVAMPQFHGF